MNNNDSLFNPSNVASLLKQSDKEKFRNTLLKFLIVLDSVDRLCGFKQSGQPGFKNDWTDHFQALRYQLLDAFKQAGVTFFESVGKQFDPAFHEAIKIVKDNEKTNNIIIEELSRGCKWNGEVLRYAKVIVVKNTVS